MADSILGNLSTQDFLAHYWQQRHYFVAASCPNLIGIIDGDELAGLACEADVESRIVVQDTETEQWQCDFGPFNEADFGNLPDNDWSLLIQSVDQILPDIAEILNKVDFLPRWRLEDIMLSYAAKHGSVGAHFDYYDVFLIQISGTREWKIGQQCDATSPLQANQPLKLLADFESQASYTCNAGDMLYIPAGLAHWGVANDDNCITCSIGFRAPSYKESLIAAAELIAEQFSDSQRYRDEPIKQGVDSYLLKPNLDELKASIKVKMNNAIDQAIDDAFAVLVTTAKQTALETIDIDYDALHRLFSENQALYLHTDISSRIAYRGNSLFLNGLTYDLPERLAKQCCSGDLLSKDWLEESHLQSLRTLLMTGAVYFDLE